MITKTKLKRKNIYLKHCAQLAPTFVQEKNRHIQKLWKISLEIGIIGELHLSITLEILN